MLFFKLPFQEQIFTTDGNSNENAVHFFSFDNKQNIGFKGNINEISIDEILTNEIFSENLVPIPKNFEEETHQDYTEKLADVIHFINENKLAKLVISRRKLINYHQISLTKTFLNLCKTFPNAFAYLFISEENCWMGAFSELLGSFNKKTSEFQTMSLAGTLPINEEWTSKEIEEQKPVSDYISEILKKYSDQVQVSETYDHISGNIKHLRTDFSEKITPQNLEKLIAELHPTPAVCGIPKDFCQNAIQNFEKYPRELYAGFTKIETENEIYYFVNLRCAKWYKNAVQIFVGGGITKDSNPEKEWQETELKAEAIAKNLAIC